MKRTFVLFTILNLKVRAQQCNADEKRYLCGIVILHYSGFWAHGTWTSQEEIIGQFEIPEGSSAWAKWRGPALFR